MGWTNIRVVTGSNVAQHIYFLQLVYDFHAFWTCIFSGVFIMCERRGPGGLGDFRPPVGSRGKAATRGQRRFCLAATSANSSRRSRDGRRHHIQSFGKWRHRSALVDAFYHVMSCYVMAVILDLIEPEIAPFNPLR